MSLDSPEGLKKTRSNRYHPPGSWWIGLLRGNAGKICIKCPRCKATFSIEYSRVDSEGQIDGLLSCPLDTCTWSSTAFLMNWPV